VQTKRRKVQSSGTLDRRTALRWMGGIALGLCTSGCSRSFVLRTIYPESGALGPDDVTRLLAAFVATVVPGAEGTERIALLMQDPALPFGPYARALAADLTRRARVLQPDGGFDRLPAPERTAIVAQALAGGGIPARIVGGGVLFAQAGVYGGLGSEDGSCGIIGFEGRFRFRGFAEQTYPNPEAYLPEPVSTDGNPW